MELISFVFGAVTVTGVVLAIFVVAGAVKMVRHFKRFEMLKDCMKSLDEKIEDFNALVNCSIEEVQSNWEKANEELEIQILNEIESLNRVIYAYSEDSLKKAKSYTDSRIDKLAETKT